VYIGYTFSSQMFIPTLLAAASFVGQVAAHGYVPWVRINGTNIPGWDVNKGEQGHFLSTGQPF
jgi:hypothetical protein